LEEKKATEQAPEEDTDTTLGISVEDLTPQVGRRLGTSRHTGVVVTQVRPSGAGGTAGLEPGDIIASVNGKAVKDVAEFNAALKKSDLKKGVRLVVENQGMERYVLLKREQ